jgi:hypothetical protein
VESDQVARVEPESLTDGESEQVAGVEPGSLAEVRPGLGAGPAEALEGVDVPEPAEGLVGESETDVPGDSAVEAQPGGLVAESGEHTEVGARTEADGEPIAESEPGEIEADG